MSEDPVEYEGNGKTLRVFIDENVFIESYSTGFQLKAMVANKDRTDTVERGCGYYATVEQALTSYSTKTTRESGAQNVAQLTDLLDQIKAVIASVADSARTQLGKTPAVNPALGVEKKKKRSLRRVSA